MPTPRKSDAMHKLTGSISQAKTPDATNAPGRPKLPSKLSKESRRVFKRLCSLLESRRALTAGDGELLILYAITFERWQRALAHLQVEGEICNYTRLDSNGQPHEVPKENLWLKVGRESEKSLVRIIDRLGLTPLNRSKIQPTSKQEKPVEEIEPLAELLSRPRKTWHTPASQEDISEIVTRDLESA
jgi:P27 family predicted phage terminase small subunit